MSLKVRNKKGTVVEELDGMTLEHDPRGREPTLKLYTNGRIAVATSHHAATARVTRWPTMRGPAHNFAREVELEQISDDSPSRLRGDDWRFQ